MTDDQSIACALNDVRHVDPSWGTRPIRRAIQPKQIFELRPHVIGGLLAGALGIGVLFLNALQRAVDKGRDLSRRNDATVAESTEQAGDQQSEDFRLGQRAPAVSKFYHEAQSLSVQPADEMKPYLVRGGPVTVDLTFEKRQC